MTKFVGRRGHLGVAKESSRGTPVASTFWLGRNTLSFEERTTTAREEEGLGRIEDSDANFVTMKMAEGELGMDLTDKEIGIILTSLMGASPTTTGGPTYTHAYAFTNTNQHQSLALYYQDPDMNRMFPLTMVDSLQIEATPGEIVQATVGFKSKAARDWATLTPSYTSRGNKFLGQHVEVRTADTVGALSGSPLSVKGLTLSIEANTDYDHPLGTAEPEDIYNLQFSVSGSFELVKQDQTYRDYMLNGTYKALQVVFNRAATSSLTLTMPRVDFTEWEQDRSLNDIVSQSINFKASYDAANALAVISTCSLVNTYAGTAY